MGRIGTFVDRMLPCAGVAVLGVFFIYLFDVVFCGTIESAFVRICLPVLIFVVVVVAAVALYVCAGFVRWGSFAPGKRRQPSIFMILLYNYVKLMTKAFYRP